MADVISWLGRHRLVLVPILGLLLYGGVLMWGTLGPAPTSEIRAVGRSVEEARSTVEARPAARRPRQTRSVGLGLTAEELANILLFLPFVPLGAWIWPRRPVVIAVAGVATSLLIELSHLGVFRHRHPTWTDVGWNSVGVFAGLIVWMSLAYLWRTSVRRWAS